MKKLNKIFPVVGLIAFLLPGFLLAQSYPDQDKLPRDAETLYGKLDNGLTYYIKHNEEPQERASFYMIRNVGAVLENDDQNGLAHFLEHMAFNGTKNFPGKGIVTSMEKHGVSFGGGINAYTSYNETVYNISNVPITKAGLLDTCLLILHDWSNYLLLTDEEIDAERGVINEEWRTRRNVQTRLREKTSPVLFKGSKYAKRDVIGSMEIVNNFDYKTLRDFYYDWYRTDLQAIAIVGDFDVKEIEAKVKKLFSGIPMAKSPTPHPGIHEIPAHKDPYYVLATDPEATQSNLNLLIPFKDTYQQKDNYASLKNEYLINIMNTLIGNRLYEFSQTKKPPLSQGGAGVYDLVKGYKYFYLGFSPNTGKTKEALTQFYTEIERIHRYGFTISELERVKASFLASVENYFQNKDKITHDDFCKNISKEFTSGHIFTDIQHDYGFTRYFLKKVSVDDVNQLFKKLLIKDNLVITQTGPDKGEKYLSKEEILATVNQIEKSAITPYEDKAGASSLITQEVQGGKIIQEIYQEKLDAYEWILSNQSKVIFKADDTQKNKIQITAFSEGGTSLYEAKDIPNIRHIPNSISEFGLAEHDAIELNKLKAGKYAGMSVSFSDKFEYVRGYSSIKDFETALQLLYLTFEKPRFDEEVFNYQIKNLNEYLKSKQNNSQALMRDSLALISANYHPRIRVFNEDFISSLDFNKLENIYRERIADASNFTFIIIGNLSKEEAKPLVEKYIGSIKNLNRKETWIDRKVESPQGIIQKTIYLPMKNPKGNVNIQYSNQIKYNRRNRILLRVLSNILKLRYTESIREEEGGAYGVQTYDQVKRLPKGEFNLFVSFDCDYSKATHLKKVAYQEIDKLLQNPPLVSDFNKVIANMKKGYEEFKNSPNFWNHVLTEKYQYDEDVLSPDYYENIVNTITITELQKFAQKFIKKANLVEVVFLPEEAK